jgi:HAE1 family hydrophobic/amphiphilic exporter-1
VDPVALKRYALSATDIVAAIQSEHTEPPSGLDRQFKQREYSLRTLGEEKTVDAFSKILINSRGGGPNYNPIPISAVAKGRRGRSGRYSVCSQQWSAGCRFREL